MNVIRVGLIADPALPTQIARTIGGGHRSVGDDRLAYDVDVVSEPFTTECEDIDTALRRLHELAQGRDWDLVIGLTELPLRDDDRRYLLMQSDREQRTAVLSLPALGGIRLRTRARRAFDELVRGLSDSGTQDEHRVPLARMGARWRVLLGMVLANRPWLLVPGLKSALVAALATGAVATINSTVWLLADSLAWWRLAVATIASVVMVVVWLVVDGELWDHPDDDSRTARDRSRLYNASTFVTLTAGVLICYLALYVVNLLWALFVLDPSVMGGSLNRSFNYQDLLVLAWLVASAATVGGGLGSGLESDEAIHAATYSKREEERRLRVARKKRD
jgi:hypothetical protein